MFAEFRSVRAAVTAGALALGGLGALTLSPPADAADVAPLELTWEDLLPPGEDELLDQLYEDYYTDLEQRMLASLGEQKSLFDWGAEPVDAAPDASADGDVGLMIEEGSEFDMMVQIGTFNVVPELDGKSIRLPGFVVPFEFSANDVYSEFLFVPYFGACIHSPPPPPNQILYVTMERPTTIPDIYRPFWIEGVLATQRNENELGDAAYTLRLSGVEPYEG